MAFKDDIKPSDSKSSSHPSSFSDLYWFYSPLKQLLYVSVCV